MTLNKGTKQIKIIPIFLTMTPFVFLPSVHIFIISLLNCEALPKEGPKFEKLSRLEEKVYLLEKIV